MRFMIVSCGWLQLHYMPATAAHGRLEVHAYKLNIVPQPGYNSLREHNAQHIKQNRPQGPVRWCGMQGNQSSFQA
jgi:hypothetical protein